MPDRPDPRESCPNPTGLGWFAPLARPGEKSGARHHGAVDRSTVATRYWHRLTDGRVQCDLCPRACRLSEGQRGLCFVRAARRTRSCSRPTAGRAASASTRSRRSRSTTSCPARAVLSFGTAGCNLACRFCQNWDISQVPRGRHARRRGLARGDRRGGASELGCRQRRLHLQRPGALHGVRRRLRRRRPRRSGSKPSR